MKYENNAADVVSALNCARNGNVVSRLTVETEKTDNPGEVV